MTLSILSSRDADPNIAITLSFNVSFGPPSRIRCARNSEQLFDVRSHSNNQITREVIRSRYIDSTQPDITRVTVKLYSQPRVVGVYTCTVIVESRNNIASGIYDFDPRGTPGSSVVTITGEILKLRKSLLLSHQLQVLPLMSLCVGQLPQALWYPGLPHQLDQH